MSEQAKPIYEFGPFRLDAAERLLLRRGSPVALTPKVFDTLLVLVENSGHLLQKDELMTRLWPDTFVEEVTLARNVSDLRKVLGEAANGQKYIDTVPKRGYRFVAGVKEVCEESVELIVEKATRSRLVIEEEETITKTEPEAGRAWLTANGKVSSAEYLIAKITQHRLGALIGVAVLLSGVGGLAYGIYRLAASRRSSAHFEKVRSTRLTTVGNALRATVSPDGKFIAYLSIENGKYTLSAKAVATGTSLQIVQNTEGLELAYPRFSPDSNFIYYSAEEKSGPDVLYQIPVLGGPAKKMLAKVDSPITFSPDGTEFAFVRYVTDSGGELFIVNSSGEQLLHRRPVGQGFSGNGPSWSPDGKIIATGVFSNEGGRHATIIGIAVANGEVTSLSPQSWNWVGHMEWFRDGSGLVMTARENPDDSTQVWQLSYPGGKASQITNDMNSYGVISLTNSGTLITTHGGTTSHIWIAPDGDATRSRQLTFRNSANEGGAGVAWTPEGSIVYSSNAAGLHSNIWIINGDGSNPRQLTDSPANDMFPAVSPDGRTIVYTSLSAGVQNLWRMDIDGLNQKQLTNTRAWAPDFSPDGSWITCVSGAFGKSAIWKVPLDGGAPLQLPGTESSGAPAVSKNGKWIAYFYFDPQVHRINKVVIIPSAGGAPVKTLNCTPTSNSELQWSPDDDSLIYVDARQGGANLWRLPFDGSPASQLTDFKSEQIFNFYFTRDGHQLVCARGKTQSDVVMIGDYSIK